MFTITEKTEMENLRKELFVLRRDLRKLIRELRKNADYISDEDEEYGEYLEKEISNTESRITFCENRLASYVNSTLRKRINS